MSRWQILKLQLRYYLWDRWNFDRTHSSKEDPIHSMFGLSYAHYYVVPRSVLQSMPVAWQQRFVRCVEELDQVMQWQRHLHSNTVYDVRLVSREYLPLTPKPAQQLLKLQAASWPVTYERYEGDDDSVEVVKVRCFLDPFKVYGRGGTVRIFPAHAGLYKRLE